MDYVVFNRILVTELDRIALLKTTYGVKIKTFEVREAKIKILPKLGVKSKL